MKTSAVFTTFNPQSKSFICRKREPASVAVQTEELPIELVGKRLITCTQGNDTFAIDKVRIEGDKFRLEVDGFSSRHKTTIEVDRGTQVKIY